MHADDERWKVEREFFDAEEYDEGAVPEDTIRRYMECKHPYTPAEFPHWVLGDLRGKRVFELGCGDGGNSILLAKRGARLVGVDISPRAIEIAKRRAALNGVSDTTEFFAMPVEEFVAQTSEKFDVICGFALLHHVLPVLDSVLDQILRLSHAKTQFMFTEPVAYSQAIRKLRLKMTMFKTEHTPGERPLEPAEIALLERRLPNMHLYKKYFLSRLWANTLGRGRVEDYSATKRAVFHAICRLDDVLLRVPFMRGFAGIGIIVAGESPRSH